MSVTGIMMTAVLVGSIGLIIGVFLGVAGERFKVEVDEREELIRAVLPGNNCGGCGFPGCDGLAAAIVKGEAGIGDCPVGGAAVAAEIGRIMGQETQDLVRMTAFVKCACSSADTVVNYIYSGIPDCNMLASVPAGGPKQCRHGCMGYGNCVKACPFDAIAIIDGIAAVDKNVCRACKKCIAACPKNLIELVPYDNEYQVGCSSQDKGKDVLRGCKVGCVGCHKCVKVCKFDAVKVENNLAYIDQEKCKKCGACARACPRHIITPYLTEEKVVG